MRKIDGAARFRAQNASQRALERINRRLAGFQTISPEILSSEIDMGRVSTHGSLEQTWRIDWVIELAAILVKDGVKHVSADLPGRQRAA